MTWSLLCVSVIQAEDGRRWTCSPTLICAVRGSTVNFSCSYTHPDRNQEPFWVAGSGRGTVDLRTEQQDSDRVQHRCSENICTLKIEDLRESDSAQYRVSLSPDLGPPSPDSPGVDLRVTGPSSTHRPL